MKNKILSSLIVATLTLTLAGCSTNNYDFLTLPEYNGIPISTIEVVEVTDADINARVQSELAAHIVYNTITDRAVQEDDIVNLDISGRINGETYTNSDVTAYDIKIGADSLVEGFDSAIVGREIGASFIINLDFPEDYYNPEVAGQPVEYSVTINGIRSQITPELSDEFVQKISSTATNVTEYKLEIQKQLENEQASINNTNAGEQVWNYIMQYSEITEYPSDLLDAEVALIEDQYIQMADLVGVSLEVYVTNNLGLDAETFKSQNMSMAEYNLLERSAIMKIAENEDLIPSDDEFVTHYQSYLATYGFNDISELLSSVDEDTLQIAILS